jgi:hypothetical protein
MSTNPFVCQPNLQKIGGFLPFVGLLCRIDRNASFHRDSMLPAENESRDPIRRRSNMLNRPVPAM